jgi:cell surface protein SprA
VGYDGLTDSLERNKQSAYLANLQANFGINSPIYAKAVLDPSDDNFRNYRDPFYDQQKTGILVRYKEVNSHNGN